MGLCSSCGKSKDKFKDKGSKICGQIHSAVTPLHVPHEPVGIPSSCVNGHVHPISRNSRRPYPPRGSMATFPNINLTNPIRGLVSKKRNRYKEDGFNLDLTYITHNIIAMGYPASNIEGVYRNHIDEVVKFLDSKHNDHYFIYNLCSERCYDKTKFHNRVQSFPFDDHNPPMVELIQPFCSSVQEWLSQSPKNVAVVHCKAGKGRTGTMICCYLLHSGKFLTADEALMFYGTKRTQDRKGVTIPSQVRYVKYYEKLHNQQLAYSPVSMNIKQIVLQPPPTLAGGQAFVCFSISQMSLQPQGQGEEHRIQKCSKIYKSGVHEVRRGDNSLVIDLNFCQVLSDNIKVEFYSKTKIRKERQFQFWFNTFFVEEEAAAEMNHGANNVNSVDPPSNNGFIATGQVVTDQNGGGGLVTTTSVGSSERTYVLTLRKDELDIVSKKDKQNKVFSADFQVTLLLQRVPKKNETMTTTWTNFSRGRLPHLPQDTPSESSEAESSASEVDSAEDWDSVLMDGDTMDPRGVGYRILSECELASQLTSTASGDQQPELLTA